MKRALTAIALIASIVAYAAPAPYPLTVNSRAQTAPPVLVYRANEAVFRVSFTDGNDASAVTNQFPFMAWSTNATAAAVSTAAVTVVNSTSGIVDFAFSPASVNHTAGRYIYEVGVRTADGTPRVFRQGTFSIYGSPVGGNVAAVNWTTNMNWGVFTWHSLPTITVNGVTGNISSNLNFSVSAEPSTSQVTRLYDSQSTRYFETLENGTGTVWVISEPGSGGVVDTNVFSKLATEAMVTTINENLNACYTAISNQVDAVQDDVDALPAALQPYSLVRYGDLATTNTAGFAAFATTNRASVTTLITDPTEGQLLAQFRYDITNTVYGVSTWSGYVGSGLGTPASLVYANLKYYSASDALIASNRGANVSMAASGAISNIVASVPLPYTVTNGYMVAELYSAVSSTKDLTVRTGGSDTNTLTLSARPLNYATPAEVATQSAVDAKADKSTSLTINGVSGNLSTGNVWTVSVPEGGITNGQVGPLSVGGVTLDANKVEFSDENGSTAVYQSNGHLILRAILGNRIYFFNGPGQIPAGVDPAGIMLFSDKSTLYGDSSEAGINYSGGNLVINPRKVGTGDTVFAAGAIKFGPEIGGRRSFFDTDGTNLWWVNVNSVTNAL